MMPRLSAVIAWVGALMLSVDGFDLSELSSATFAESLRSPDLMDKYNSNSDPLESSMGSLPKRKSPAARKSVDRISDYYTESLPSSYEPSRSRDSAVTRTRLSGTARQPFPVNRKGYNSYSAPSSYGDSLISDHDYESDPNSKSDVFGGYDSYDNYESAYSSEPSSFVSHYLANRKTFRGSRSSNPLALLVAPLAGIAFITAAAAVAVSPAYLTITSSLTGRRKRDLTSQVDPRIADQITPELMRKVQELQTLEKFLSSIPKETHYQQQIMSMYLSCSGYMEESNVCLDHVFCEYGNSASAISEEERDVLSIVLYNIMANNYVRDSYKNRLRKAARLGRDTQQCTRYECAALSQSTDITNLKLF